MDIDPLTVIAVGGVASLIIERIFYYKARYKTKKDDDGNPGYGERIKGCETEIQNLKENNSTDHRLIRASISKLSELLNKAGGRAKG